MSGGIGQTFGNQLLALIFNATTIAGANLAQNAGSPVTNLYLSLHTADPGASGGQNTNEAAYPSYGRVAVVRTSGGWTVSGTTVSLAANQSFPTSTGSPSETETYFGVGTNPTAGQAGYLLGRGPLSSSIVVNAANITPQLTTATQITIA